MKNEIKIGKTNIGLNHPSFFIADIAANHDGDIERAKDLIYKSAEAGANAAKFQNFKAKTIVSDYGFNNMNSKVSHQSSWKKSVTQVYDEASISLSWTRALKETCHKANIEYMTTPYDLSFINKLSKYVNAWKIGSGDITYHEIIERISKEKKPILIATGASNIKEIENAIQIIQKNNNEIVIMQCNTNYTASIENLKYIQLNVLKLYAAMFPECILGLSDHTHGHVSVLGSISLGARVIEKHFTDNNNREGPDHKFAMNPKTWREMVDRSRELELCLGNKTKEVMLNEKDTVIVQRRAIRANKKIEKGTILNYQHFTFLRPCPESALPPYEYQKLIGKKTKFDLSEGEEINLEKIE